MIAECYLHRLNDSLNKVYFDHRALVVVYKGAIHRTLLRYPTRITLEHKKYIGMIITGGMISAFCLLMIWNNLYKPWPVLIGLLGSGLTFYYGWMGSWMLIVHQNSNTLSFPIPAKGGNLVSFSQFFNQHQKGLKRKMIYHISTASAWKAQQENAQYRDPSLEAEGFIHTSETEQIHGVLDRYFKDQSGLVVLMIDALLLGSPLKYEASPINGELYPHVYGPINKSSIIGVLPLGRASDFTLENLGKKLRTVV